MAVPRKGWRSISVGNRSYFWRATGRDWAIAVVVVTDVAFASGSTAQQLRFELGYDPLREKKLGRERLHQRAVVSPSVVRRAVEIARGLTPPFTGELGLPHVALPSEHDEEIRDLARTEPTLLQVRPRLSKLT